MFDNLWASLLRLQLQAIVAVMTVGITISAFVQRKRMSHENGALTRGRFRVVDNPTFPQHDFFTPGREFPCRLRHGSVLFRDDAKMCVRSAALKLSDQQFKSPFDVLMNTGRVGLFWSARTTWQFRKTNERGKMFVHYLRTNPQALFGGGDSSRRNPESFSKLSYHSQTCFGFVDTAGTYYYCRYRLIPADPTWDGTDSGELPQWWKDHNWFQNPLPDEQRTRNYLKDELRARLEGDGTIQYRFQIQTRRKPPGPDPTWVTAQYEWDDTVTPWHDVAEVTLTDALDYEESMLTWFDIGNHPSSLPVPTGVSIDDPHSVNNLRLATRRAAQARLLSYKLRGMPSKFPDTRYAPDWVPIPPMPIPPGRDELLHLGLSSDPSVRHSAAPGADGHEVPATR